MKKFFTLKFSAIMFGVFVLLISTAVVSYSGGKIKLNKLKKITPSKKVSAEALNGEFNGKILSIGETFEGVFFSYDVSFWIFKNAAKGKLRLEKGEKPGEYTGIMEAQTTGVLGFFLRHRKDIYISKVVEIDGGKRFRTVSFENQSLVGKKKRITLQTVDYEKRIFTKRVWSKGRERSGEKREIPAGQSYDDPVAGFYNLRYGAYGEIKEGSNFKIQGLPKKDELFMTVHVKTEEEFKKRLSKDLVGEVRYICDIHIDKELFDSKSGNIELYLSETMVPVVAVAKDVMMFGDVYGVLQYERDKETKEEVPQL